jgi:acyl-lipid omega-6 desaturase (Delta-12 desaturase)
MQCNVAELRRKSGALGGCVMPKSWSKKLQPYRVANNWRALFEIVVTGSAFVASWIASYKLFLFHPYLSALLALPTAGFLVRLFMLQHDCGHLSMFSSKHANDWVGRALGVLTLTPYDY